MPRLPPIQHGHKVTYLDRTGAVIGVRGGRFSPALDVARLPRHVPGAVVAIEDRRFYEHTGFDPVGMASAIVGGLAGERMRGASTITQQTARLLFLNQDRTFEAQGDRAGCSCRASWSSSLHQNHRSWVCT